MESELIPNGEADASGVVPMTQGITFKMKVTAEGERREDGLTATQVRQELKEKAIANGS